MKRISQLELLRVLCMAAVFFFHLYSVVPTVGKEGLIGSFLSAVLNQGYVGVVVFNMIAAFVLTLPHAPPDARPPLGYPDFFRRRFARICPLYYLALVLFTFLAIVFSKTPLSEIAIAFVQHVFFVHTLDPARFFAIVPAFWWIGLLAQFYLVYPLLLKAFLRFGAGRTLAVICVVCYSGWWLLIRVSNVFPDSSLPLVNYMLTFNLPVRLPEFALGMFMAMAWKASQARSEGPGSVHPVTGINRRATLLMAVCAVISITAAILFKKAVSAPFGHVLVVAACLFGAATLFAMPFAARIGRNRWMVRLAVASYGIYLVHQPLLRYSVSLLDGRLHPLAAFCVVGLVAGFCAYTLAVALERVVANK